MQIHVYHLPITIFFGSYWYNPSGAVYNLSYKGPLGPSNVSFSIIILIDIGISSPHFSLSPSKRNSCTSNGVLTNGFDGLYRMRER